MKKRFQYLSFLCLVLLLLSCEGIPDGYTRSRFKVWGNCDMCKKTIESSMKKGRIKSARWDKKTKIMEVVYDPKTFALEDLHDIVANAGYDTELRTASDSAYKHLHTCCKYVRK